MTQPFFAQQVVSDEILVIDPGAVLDNNNAHEMVEDITTAGSRGFRYVIIDMTSLEFLSSAGVGSILGTVEILREAGGDIVLCNLSSTIRHVLEVLDLTDYLTIRTNREQAATQCGITE